MSNTIHVVQYGLGPIGGAVARLVVERAGLELVGGVDIDPAKVGRDIGNVIGLGTPLNIPVEEKLTKALARAQADIVLHTTSSYFDRFGEQLLQILEAGLDIISTSEELSFPWLNHPNEAAQINEAAKRAGKTVLGTGVNPGFLMDYLPLNLTAICQCVDHIDVRRIQNASTRRRPFQLKIGAGMEVEEFRSRIRQGSMGHVGLFESAAMVTSALGKEMVSYDSRIEPILADHFIKTPYIEVQPNQVRGIKQIGLVYTEEGEFVRLTFIAALEYEEDQDTISITGKPNITLKLRGANGDLATTAIVVNAIRRVREADPGLISMCDLPIITIW